MHGRKIRTIELVSECGHVSDLDISCDNLDLNTETIDKLTVKVLNTFVVKEIRIYFLEPDKKVEEITIGD